MGENAKHGKIGTLKNVVSKLKVKIKKGHVFNPKQAGTSANPLKDMEVAAKLMQKNKFACDAAEFGPVGRNPILDQVKAQKKKLEKMKGRKAGKTKYDEELEAAKNYANSFYKGQYNVIVLDEPITLYRAGPASRKMGQFWTRVPPKNRFEVRYDAAVKKEWSELDTVFKLEIPAGTKLYEGYIAPQGKQYVGMGKQIFINKPWEIPGVTEDMVKVIGKWNGKAGSFDFLNGMKRYTKGKHAAGVGASRQVLSRCDDKNWYGINARSHGTCEKIHVGGCQDGIFVKGYCENEPSNVRCCLRKSCAATSDSISGMCVRRSKCVDEKSDGIGFKWQRGLCPNSPSWVRCC